MRRILGAGALLAVASVATPALAHAFLDHTVPAVGSTVAAAPARVEMYFTQEIEPSFSGATLTTIDGRAVAAAAAVEPGNPAEMVLAVPALAPGKYRVDWHVVSTDTHRTEGNFTFEIRP